MRAAKISQSPDLKNTNGRSYKYKWLTLRQAYCQRLFTFNCFYGTPTPLDDLFVKRETNYILEPVCSAGKFADMEEL